MSILSLIALALSLLQNVLTGLGGNPAFAKVASEIAAAVAALTRAHAEVVTNAELDSLRTKVLW